MAFEIALKEIERHIKVYKAFEEAQNALVALASLEQHTKELEKTKQSLENFLDQLKKEVIVKEEQLIILENKIVTSTEILELKVVEVEKQKVQELETRYSILEEEKKEQIQSLEEQEKEIKLSINNHATFLHSQKNELASLEVKIQTARDQIQRICTRRGVLLALDNQL